MLPLLQNTRVEMQAECLSCGIALQVMCPVLESDTQEHVRLLLEAERRKATFHCGVRAL